MQTESYEILNKIQQNLDTGQSRDKIEIAVSANVFNYLNNVEYKSILHLEKLYKCKIILIKNES